MWIVSKLHNVTKSKSYAKKWKIWGLHKGCPACTYLISFYPREIKRNHAMRKTCVLTYTSLMAL